MTTTSINTATGNVTIDSAVFTGYYQEALEYLDQIAEHTAGFKGVVETVAETTKLDKGVVGKFFKARYAEKTKEAKALGDIFETLDGILA